MSSYSFNRSGLRLVPRASFSPRIRHSLGSRPLPIPAGQWRREAPTLNPARVFMVSHGVKVRICERVSLDWSSRIVVTLSAKRCRIRVSGSCAHRLDCQHLRPQNTQRASHPGLHSAERHI